MEPSSLLNSAGGIAGLAGIVMAATIILFHSFIKQNVLHALPENQRLSVIRIGLACFCAISVAGLSVHYFSMSDCLNQTSQLTVARDASVGRDAEVDGKVDVGRDLTVGQDMKVRDQSSGRCR